MIEPPLGQRTKKSGNDSSVDDGHQRSVDLHQRILLFHARICGADAFERFRPELADRDVTPFEG
jgi:hypothetical protein